MDIGMIGSGNMGGALTVLLARAGHRVTVANSRGPETLGELVAEAGDGARAATAPEAVAAGAVVFVTIPYVAAQALLAEAGPWDGKVLVDVTNYYRGRDGDALDPGQATSSSEVLAGWAPGARVVKAFNTIWSEHLRGDGGMEGRGRRAIPLAGDDEDAKATVAALVTDIGFEPVDRGPLAAGKAQEPGAPVYNVPLTAAELRERG